MQDDGLLTYELDTIQQRFEADMQRLGKRIREEYVIPLCAKHGLDYFCQPDTFWFIIGEEGFNRNDDAVFLALPHAAQKDLEPVLDLMNKCVMTHCVGLYVDSLDVPST